MPSSQLTTLHAVALVLELFKDCDVTVEMLLHGSGIAPADLERPDTRITTTQEMKVCANALCLKQDLGVALGQRMRVSAYGMLGYALLSSATLGDALRLALQYPALLGTFFQLRLIEADSHAWLIASHYRDEPALEAFNIELCLTSLKSICNDLLGEPLPLDAVHFTFARPTYTEVHRTTFGCSPTFEAPCNALVFDLAWLHQRLPLADRVTHRDMYERCRRQNTEFTVRHAWLERLRRLLADQLPATPGLAALAQQMHCSPRTLRRHLQALGTSYQDLLDELRFERAKILLSQEKLPIYQIAEVLGFSETASFRHAFQRWSGVSPSRFRL